MNANLLAIVNRIVAEQGEGILADAKRLFPFFADYAKNEYKEDRVAFGRCIEMGAYQELKKAGTADERRRVKATLIDQVNAKTGIDRPHCSEALDLLEAVMFRPEQQSSPLPQQAKAQNKILKFIKDNDTLGKGYITLFILTLVLGTLTREYHILPDGVWLDVIGVIVAAPLAFFLLAILLAIPIELIKWIIKKIMGTK
jgi:hypothetical protein